MTDMIRDAEIAALRAEVERLREALQCAINVLDHCPHHERGIGGMTIDAQIRRTVINQVPAVLVEDLLNALAGGGA